MPLYISVKIRQIIQMYKRKVHMWCLVPIWHNYGILFALKLENIYKIGKFLGLLSYVSLGNSTMVIFNDPINWEIILNVIK